MTTTRTNDLLFLFSGGFPFSQEFPISPGFDLGPYNQSTIKDKNVRKLLTASRGADNDIDGNVKTMMGMIREFVDGRTETIGRVCLLGRSNGCALALGVAAELNDLGITDLTFVGLSDVPMWDTGRVPPVAKVGDFKPKNGPIAAGAVSPNPGIGGFLSVGNASAIPVITLNRTIKANKKINLFQIQGNHMRWSNSAKRWCWYSGFSAGEVHGRLEGGFDDRLCVVGETFLWNRDLKLHISLNTGEHWRQMMQEAQAAFAGFPP